LWLLEFRLRDLLTATGAEMDYPFPLTAKANGISSLGFGGIYSDPASLITFLNGSTGFFFLKSVLLSVRPLFNVILINLVSSP